VNTELVAAALFGATGRRLVVLDCGEVTEDLIARHGSWCFSLRFLRPGCTGGWFGP